MGVTQTPTAFEDTPDPGDCALVLSPALETETNRTCTDLLTLGNPADKQVLWVTLHESPQERIDIWEDHCSVSPHEAAIIDVGTGIDFHQDHAQPMLGGSPVPVTEITTPQDLTKLGIEIIDQLERWNHEERQIVVCFHSLTTFLQYVDLQDAFKFMHALTARLSQRGAIAHFHMDPDAHEATEISTLLSLFQSVVEYEDEEWTYQSR